MTMMTMAIRRVSSISKIVICVFLGMCATPLSKLYHTTYLVLIHDLDGESVYSWGIFLQGREEVMNRGKGIMYDCKSGFHQQSGAKQPLPTQHSEWRRVMPRQRAPPSHCPPHSLALASCHHCLNHHPNPGSGRV